MEKLTEAEIQNLILGWLLSNGFYCWRNNSVGVYDPKLGKHRKRNGVGALNGVSDILGILPDGRFLAIEVKGPHGRATTDQDLFMSQINGKGGLAFVANSLEAVTLHLSSYATR